MDDIELRSRLERIEEGLANALSAAEELAHAVQEHRLVSAGVVGDLKSQLAVLSANVSQVVSALPPLVQSNSEAADALRGAVAEMRQARSTYEWGDGMKAARAEDGKLPDWAVKAGLILLAIIAALVGVKELLPAVLKALAGA